MKSVRLLQIRRQQSGIILKGYVETCRKMYKKRSALKYVL